MQLPKIKVQKDVSLYHHHHHHHHFHHIFTCMFQRMETVDTASKRVWILATLWPSTLPSLFNQWCKRGKRNNKKFWYRETKCQGHWWTAQGGLLKGNKCSTGASNHHKSTLWDEVHKSDNMDWLHHALERSVAWWKGHSSAYRRPRVTSIIWVQQSKGLNLLSHIPSE